MNNKQNQLMIIIILIAGFFGGFVSSWIFNTIKYEKLTTKHLQIVDDDGNIRIKLYASPNGNNDLGSTKGAHMEFYNNNGSLFSLLSTQTQSLSFHDKDNVNKSFSLGPKLISLSDGDASRITLGYVSNQNTREKYKLEPYTMVFFDENHNVVWSAPKNK